MNRKLFNTENKHIYAQEELSIEIDIKSHISSFNPYFIVFYHATGLFLYPLKISDYQRCSDVLRG